MDPEENQQTPAAEPAPAQPSTEPAAEPQGQPETVPLEKATHDEVKNALQEAMAQEALGDSEPESEPDPSGDVSDANTPKDPQPSGKEPVAEPTPAGAKPPTQTAAPATQQPVQGTQADEERRKQIGQKRELFFREQTNWYNSVKTQNQNARTFLENRKAQLSQGLEELWQSDVRTATARDKEIADIDQKLDGLTQTDQRVLDIYESRVFFAQRVDPEITIDDLAGILKLDETPEQYVAQFRNNPWEFTTPEALVQIGRRAMERKISEERLQDNRILVGYIEQLKKENAALKARPAQMVKRVQQHLNNPSPVTGAGNASNKAPVDLDPTKLDRKSLKEGIAAGNIAH
jgi:hypothetical protein